MRLFWNKRAQRDVEEAAAYIARDNPAAANRWITKIRRRVLQLIEFPDSGRAVPDWGDDVFRELIDGNYRIVYKRRENEIEIMIVFERHRRGPKGPKNP